MSRIDDAFARMRAEKRTGLVTYVTAGDPSLAVTGQILERLDAAGVDVLEVGVPFSDPLADGPVIQRATERALAAGAHLDGVLDMLATVRPRFKRRSSSSATPIRYSGWGWMRSPAGRGPWAWTAC